MEALDIYSGELVEVPFYSQRYVPSKITIDKYDGSSITETAYVPPQIQIADMMLAGISLAEQRRARFDSVELEISGEEDIPLDPLREPGIDLVDVQKEIDRVTARLNAQAEKNNREAKEKSDAEQKDAYEKRIQEELALRGKA